jgi:predicted MPP superfamily phosphohydrolase
MSPDLVALTGDYQTYPQDVEEIARLLAPLGIWSGEARGGKGVVAVLGNHDHEAGKARVTDALRRAGIPVLSNSHIRLTRGGTDLYIVGVADPWSGRADLDRALHRVPNSVCTVLLAHVPDYLVESAGRVDLQLSGHNHGGQIKLPFLGALLVSSRYGRRYVEGFHRRSGTLMYVSRGIGGKPAIRLGSKPEITRFILRSAP